MYMHVANSRSRWLSCMKQSLGLGLQCFRQKSTVLRMQQQMEATEFVTQHLKSFHCMKPIENSSYSIAVSLDNISWMPLNIRSHQGCATERDRYTCRFSHIAHCVQLMVGFRYDNDPFVWRVDNKKIIQQQKKVGVYQCFQPNIKIGLKSDLERRVDVRQLDIMLVNCWHDMKQSGCLKTSHDILTRAGEMASDSVREGTNGEVFVKSLLEKLSHSVEFPKMDMTTSDLIIDGHISAQVKHTSHPKNTGFLTPMTKYSHMNRVPLHQNDFDILIILISINNTPTYIYFIPMSALIECGIVAGRDSKGVRGFCVHPNHHTTPPKYKYQWLNKFMFNLQYIQGMSKYHSNEIDCILGSCYK